jgi:hypothetical protein
MQSKKKGQKSGQKKKISKTKTTLTRKKSAFTHSGGDLAVKLMSIMEKNREVSM